MSNNTIADNWSLQDIVSLFNDGITEDRASNIKIDRNNNYFRYEETLASIVQITALFELLNDVVLRDQVIIDERFAKTWSGRNSLLDGMSNASIIRAFPFDTKKKDLVEIREGIVGELCVTDDLKVAHNENMKSWQDSETTPHNFLSQVLWGGAGMAARAAVYEHSYTPHPLRKWFFSSTGFYLNKSDALSQVGAFINTKRALIKKERYGSREVNTLAISIQPLVTKIIRESTCTKDLIENAISFRDEYRELRDWIRMYQEAILEPNQPEIEKVEKVLKSISRYIDSKRGLAQGDQTSFSVGFSAFNVTQMSNPLNSIINRFGVRSCISELILTETWEADLRKFLGFFGERSTKLGNNIIQHYYKTMV